MDTTYTLTQQEYTELTKDRELKFSLSKKKLQKLCTNIADTMPIVWGWNGPDPKPWGCILQHEDDEWYCDKCPVSSICPNENKAWSK